ncbi:peptidoglycan DD-metalloendopeptidase family protein [Hansschlegelia beijingensis]|uniref:Murein DD-endopeptidase MepM/ murein hydrolase activator NlpD n=1 Tax=Hansschlegelia beijingensis TaxID=1133344 RepID=A0A7W6CWD6_9HYPH|nr:M23 family metallopeptidase [Hansschlegelia beijingensis]MBB3972325.1 murein DD-endopeptidase MepM/ murein hydrolase activator NlpD [Hansschlegelia beijingensis]
MAAHPHVQPRRAADERIVIERGGRRITVCLPRHGVTILSALILGLLLWSAGAGAYMLFHDTVVAELRHGARAARQGYEAQISALRDELGRVRTRRLVEKAGLDARLAELAGRQEALERRQLTLAALTEPVRADMAEPGLSLVYPSKPRPLDSRAALDDISADDAPERSRPASGLTDRLAAAMDETEQRQVRALESVASKTGERRLTLEKVYDAVGARRPGPADGKARGGPFEPLPARALTFEARAAEIAAERAAVEALEHGLDRVPLRTPAPGASVTSGFGARTDPFLGRAAFHAGVDFEETHGETVKATAAGHVTVAGPTGGYGNMVEIDHGGGLTTRYGHLSSIAVSPGQAVRLGTTLGRVGSTGRSTGPHLHYETRVNGEAVDPFRFLNAGRMLAAAGR